MYGIKKCKNKNGYIVGNVRIIDTSVKSLSKFHLRQRQQTGSCFIIIPCPNHLCSSLSPPTIYLSLPHCTGYSSQPLH